MDDTGIETAEPIFELATKCESLFSEHISRLKNESDLNGAKVVGEYQQRFSAWAAFLGVFAVPDMCLDRRLRSHVEVQDLVLRLLDIMKRNLVHLLETDYDKPTFNQEDIDIPDLDQDSSPQIRVNLESLRGIEGAVDRLNHLGRTIQRSSEAGQATKVGKFVRTFDSTPFEDIARLAVKSFYPDASTSLLEQLIQAMTDIAQDLSEHLSKLHDNIFTRPQIQVIVHQSQLRSPRPQDICPLCCLSMRDEDQDKEREHLKMAQSDHPLKDQLPGESHKRMKTETGSIEQIQNIDVGSEGENGERASNTGAQAAQNTQRVNIEAISRHIAAHLQGIMLFTLRIMSLDVTYTTADEKSLSNSTDHDSSRVGSGQKRSEQETSTIIDILEEQDSNMDVDDPSIEDTIPDCENIIDWQDVISSTQQFPETDNFLQEVIRSGAFHSKESTGATSFALVRSVQDALRMHITDSREKLETIHENSLKKELCQVSLSFIALAGIETMADILEGHQNASPLDLLCFIHIVFSLSLVIHEHDALKYAATLLKQALLYSGWFSEPDRTSFIEVVITLWGHIEVDNNGITQLLQSTIPDSRGKQPEHSLHILKSDPLVLLAAYFLDELEHKTLHEHSYKGQPSELADQHYKDSLVASSNSPFTITAKYMIENIFSHQYSYSPQFELALPEMPKTRASIPPLRNEYFVCPEDVFNVITKHSSEPSSCVALVGLGGVGKSQLALEFAYRTTANSAEVWIFWIYADTQEHIEEGFRRIAECLELPGQNLPWVDLFQLVYDWLSDERNDRWIIIFDGIYDELLVFDIGLVIDSSSGPKIKYGLKSLMHTLLQPQRRNGSIIVTTRDKTLGLELTRYPRHVIEIKPMPVVDATSLFRKILGPKFQAALDMNVVINLVKALGLIPLAITQAALYIEQHLPQITLNKYLEKLEESDEEKVKLLKFDAGLHGIGTAPNTILTTWQMSFDAIRSQQPSAIKLLSLMSFFDRRGIPKWLIAPYTQDDNTPRASSPNIMGRLELSDSDSETNNDTDDTFNKDIEILINHYCIGANRTKEIFEIHGLVQLAAQRSLDDSEIQAYREQFIRRLAAKFPRSPLSNLSTCQELFAHVQEAAKYHPSGNVSEDWATILYNGGRYARLQGDYDTAKQMSNKISKFRENRERSIGEKVEDMRLLENLSLNALILMDQGLYEEAHKLFTQIVDTFNIMEAEGKVETNHHDVLTSMNNLASIYRIQGRWKEAEKLVVEIEDRRKEAMEKARGEISEDTRSVLATQANLASIYKAQGRYEAAEGLQLSALIGCEIEFGDSHPQTLTNRSNLASIYRIQGELERAEHHQVQAMNMRDIKFGREHPDTLTSMNSLASIFRAQGRLSDAEELQVQVVELRKEKLGSGHPNTLASMNNLALIYKAQGKGERAIELQSVVVKMCEAKLGPNHPHTLTSINNMALIWKSQGEHEESMRLMKFCSETRQRNLGQEHPYTISSMAAVKRWSE
ncbi:hypothetical protein GGI43DRAFT_425308 [Trichoderma evansii]